MRSFIGKKRGQNVVEYLLLVTAVAILVLTVFPKNGGYTKAINKMISAPMNMLLISNRIMGNHLQPVDTRFVPQPVP
jgi:hypothetical protein